MIDSVNINERIARLTKRSIKNESKMQALKMAISMMDLTTLEAKDTPGKVRQLCAKAIRPHEAMPELPSAAAVCVYPTMVRVAKEACGKAHLKVILETGELSTYDNVRRASDIAMYAGADFIKTSTGKIQPAATLPVTLVMLEAIRDFYYKEGKMVGMKPAGGISTAKLAIQYLVVLRETLGEAWMNADYFRFGASSLANDLLMQIVKQLSGVYQSGDYFSKD